MGDLSFGISDTRGETPENIKSLALRLCKDYLGFAWNRVTENELIFWRISGGLTNQLYYCAIPDSLPLEGDEPREVALRIYGKKHIKVHPYENERFADTVISLFAANHGLGAKIYGTFPDGQIEEYIRGIKCEKEHMDDDNILTEIAQKLAHYHYMKIPIINASKWYYTPYTLRYCFALINERDTLNEINRKYNIPLLNNIDLRAEIDWVLNCVENMGSPIVFAHNDFSWRNMMVINDENRNNRIKFCDFEMSTFSYRGYDFGNFFAQWKQTSLFELNIVSDDIIERFARNYLNEAIKLNGQRYANDTINNVKQLLRETKIFRISWFLLLTLWLLQLDDTTLKDMAMTRESSARAAEHMTKEYFKLKQLFIKENENI